MVQARLAHDSGAHRRGRRLLPIGAALTIVALLVMGASAGTAQASSVISPTVTLSSTAAGVAGVTYVAEFTTTGALAANAGTITVALPTGSVIANQTASLANATTGQFLSSTGAPTFGNGHATATWTVGSAVPAGTKVQLTLPAVTSAGAGFGQAQISTSADTTVVGTSPFQLTVPQSLTSASLSLSSTVQGVKGVSYAVDFTTSSTGDLQPGQGTITLSLPAGTVIPNQTISVTDLTGGQVIGTGSPTLTNSGATGTWTVGAVVPAGDRIELQLDGITNPTTGGTVTVSTSSDTQTTTSTPTFTAAQPLSSASLSLSSTVQGVKGVSYAVDFTTSSTGDLQPGQGTITLSLPAGTVIPNQTISVTDLTGGQVIGTGSPTLTNSGATGTWTVGAVVPAGDRIELQLDGITNPTTGRTVTVSTSSDTQTTTSTPTFTAAQPLSSASLSLSSTVQGVKGVSYAVDFTTSSTGDLQPGQGTITLSLPAGTVIPNQTISVTDLTGGQVIGTGSPTLTNSGATGTWTVGAVVPAGDRIELQLDGITNPTTGGTVTVSTSSDTQTTTSTPTFTAAQPISSAIVELSDPTASQTGVSYTLDFTVSSTGGLQPGQGTITAVFPNGTVIPNQSIAITDLTGGQSIGTGAPTLSNGGATATWTVGAVVPAGDRIQLVITGVQNPVAGNYSISISTSSDSGASTPTYSIGTSTPPSFGPSVLLSSAAASVSGVTYEVTFFNPTALSNTNGDSIGLAAVTGTTFPNSSLSIFDLTSGKSLGNTFGPGGSGPSLTWPLSQTIPADHEIRVTIAGVTNPSATPVGTAYALTVLRSGQRLTPNASYQITNANSVTAGGVTLSTPAVGLHGVTYSVEFTTSSTTGTLYADQGTITLTAPTGTVFPNQGLTLTDLTTGQGLGNTFSPGGTGSSLTWTVTSTVPAGHTIRATITNVQNPTNAVTTNQIGIDTSSDTAATSSNYTTTATNALTPGRVTLSTPGIGLHGVTYSVEFTTTAKTGTLYADQGTITLTAPTGTVFPNQGLTLTDLTTGQGLGNTFSPGGTGSSLTWTVTSTVPAGHTIRATITNVQNPTNAVTTNQIGIDTSSDTAATSSNYTTTATNALTPGRVTLSTPGIGLHGVTYSVEFTTTAKTGTLYADQGTITLTAPTGTVFPNQGLTLTDLTTGQGLGNTFSPGGTGSSLTWTVTSTVPAGHTIRATITNVQNPTSAVTTNQIGIDTSSDTAANSSNYTTTAANALIAGGVTLSTAATGASNATYSLEFTTSATGTLYNDQGTITLVAPTGTVFPNQSLALTDLTTGQGLGNTFNSGATGNTLTWIVTSTIPAGHTIRAIITNVQNPSSASTADQIAISTSSDSGASTPRYTIGTPTAVASPSVSLSNNAVGAAGVTYTANFTPTSTVASGSGTITIVAPTGTVFPNAGVDVFDVTSNTDLGNTGAPTLSNGGGTATWPIGSSSVAAGHQIRLTAANVTNPPSAGIYQLNLTSSTDTAIAQTAPYTIGGSGPGAPTISAINPTFGPTGGGTTVTVTGTNFIAGTTVKFGATTASNVVVVSGTSLTAASPPGAGAVDVTVTTAGGTSATSAADRFTYGPPTVTAVSPSSGPAAGGTTVTISGTNFAPNTTSVKFGAATASNVVVTGASSLTVTSPAGSGTVDVKVTTPAGTSAVSAVDQYTYTAFSGPTVTSISPSSGPSAGGTGVTITGTNFVAGAGVKFGSAAATNVAVVDSTQITATSPPGSGTVDVTVATAGGTSATSAADSFTYNPPPPPAPPPPAAAVVTGGSPTAQTSNGASVAGSVNPEGVSTQAFFEYGLDLGQRGPGASTTLYDQQTPAQQVGADTAVHTVTAPLTGLVPGALYHVRLVAINAAGTTFGPDQTFTTAAAPAPPPPVLGQSQDVKPVSGKVFIKNAAGQFVPLTGATQIPSGTVVDARAGTLNITAALPGGSGGARDAAGKKPKPKLKTQSGNFGGAIFKLTQARSGLTNLSLVEGAFQGAPTYATCKAHKASDATAAAVSSKTLQLLHASAHGKFKTSGRYSAATVRGTNWTVADRCDGTLTHDLTDSIAVTDFVRHKTIILHAGQSYLALAKPPHKPK